MIIIYSDSHKAHQPPKDIYDGEFDVYAETAQRVDAILDTLKSDKGNRLVKPVNFPVDHIYAIHQPRYVAYVKSRSESLGDGDVLYPSYFITDTHAPIVAGTYDASLAAVDVALSGARKILEGERAVYSLCRPPGHHAAHRSMGGYCYFNNAAISANFLAKNGRTAILDIDFHHGNGTQEAFYERDDVLYVSVHADPEDNYPYITGFVSEKGTGKGEGYNINYPVDTDTDDSRYMDILEKALKDIAGFQPEYLVVSAGFDTFARDPIGGLKLSEGIYHDIGKKISALNLPTLIIQEGGYDTSVLGTLVSNFLNGFESGS